MNTTSHTAVSSANSQNPHASGRAPNALPIYNNTCYSFVSDTDVVHVASVHRYDAEKKTMLTVPGSGGLSASASALEGQYAMAWARNIWADTLA